MESPHEVVVETYFDGFRRSDHEQILACLTDDVARDLPHKSGERHRFVCCDVFTFAGDEICRVESYLVPLTSWSDIVNSTVDRDRASATAPEDIESEVEPGPVDSGAGRVSR